MKMNSIYVYMHIGLAAEVCLVLDMAMCIGLIYRFMYVLLELQEAL